MHQQSISAFQIKKVNNEFTEIVEDVVAVEEPLEIRIVFGNKENRIEKIIAVTMRTPIHDFELAIGFLFTEGIINSYDQVASISYLNKSIVSAEKQNQIVVELKENVQFEMNNILRNFYTTSSCGVCGKSSIDAIRTVNKNVITENNFTVKKEILLSLNSELINQQNIFEITGGLHASAFFDSTGKLELVCEDVGRHNALDKLIGTLLIKKLEIGNHILLLSGRASFELIQKAAMAKIKTVCAVGAPSSLAVELAKEFNITLVGFLRNNKFNIYSNLHNII